MEDKLAQQLQIDSQEVRNMMSQAISEAVKTLPKPDIPSWLERTIDFVKIHPWISLFLLLGFLLLVSAIIREILCAYFKTNEIAARLKRVEDLLRKKEQV